MLSNKFGQRLSQLFKAKKKEHINVGLLNNFIFMKDFTHQTKVNLLRISEILERRSGW
jgi:hypothetical protein